MAEVPLGSYSSRFVGRRAELDGLSAALPAGRLLTLVGPGGVGKTRLAIELVERSVARIADQAWMVRLDAVSEAPFVPSAFAQALAVEEVAGMAWSELLEARLAEGRNLVLVDNCEHLLEPVADLVAHLLSVCPGLAVVATSREPLRVIGEQVHQVRGLEEADAMELFRHLAPTSGTGDVAELCRRLDGLPLALEIAAARTPGLTVRQLLDQMDAHVNVLGRGIRAATPRHRTLEATIKWSVALLDKQERRLFVRICAFPSSFTATAAEALAGEGESPVPVVEGLAALVEKSMVARSDDQLERYRLLEVVRSHGRRLLEDSGDLPAVRDLHAYFYLELVSRLVVEVARAGARPALAAIREEMPNLRAALSWWEATRPSEMVRLCLALSWYWFVAGQMSEGADWLRRALAKADLGRERARLLVPLARLAWMQSKHDYAEELLRESLAIAQDLADSGGRGRALNELAVVQMYHRQFDAGRATALEALGIAEREGRLDASAAAGWAVGLADLLNGSPDGLARAVAELGRSVELRRRAGHPWGLANSLLTLAIAHCMRAEAAQARSILDEVFDLMLDVDDRWSIPGGLLVAAEVVAREGDPRRAQILKAAGLTQWERLSARPQRALTPELLAVTGLQTGPHWRGVGATDRARLAAIGEGLTPQEAVDCFRGRFEPEATHGLSRREMQIAELVATGLSNKEIGARLFLSERTVANHVQHVLDKLEFRSRAQIATWVTSEKLSRD